jgi:HEAT repeat protein
MLGTDNEYLRSMAAGALVKLGTRDVNAQLIQRMRRQHVMTPDSTPEPGMLLAHLWNTSDVPRLLEFLAPGEPLKLRAAAARALGRLGARESVPALMRSLSDAAVELRHEAARALGLLGAREAIPELEKNLLLQKDWARDVTAEALGRIGGPEAAPQLARLLGDKETDVYWAGVGALAHADPAQAIPFWIVRLVWECDRWVEQNLEAFPGESLPALQKLLGHPDWWVRWYIAPIHNRLRAKAGEPRSEEALASASARSALEAVFDISDRALALLPTWDVARLLGADALRRLGYRARAKHRLEATPFQPSFMTLGSLARTQCLLDLEQRDDALELLESLAFDRADEPVGIAEAARLFERAGNLMQAEQCYDRAIAIARPYGFHRHRAAFLIRQARFAEAAADCLRAAELEQLYSSRDRASLERVRRYHPEQERQAGLLALAQGRFEEALSAFQASRRREPAGLSAYDQALASLAAGRTPEAAWRTIDGTLAAMELREQAEAALADFNLLARAIPDLPALSPLRERLEQAAIRVGRMSCDKPG